MQSNLNLAPVKRLIGSSTDVLVGFPDKLVHPSPHWNDDQKAILERHAPAWLQEGAKPTMDIAKKLTYGDGDTPARPFLEEGILLEKDQIGQLAGLVFKGKIDGVNEANALKALGAAAAGAVKKFIYVDNPYRTEAPNSWLTIAVKSRSQKGSVKQSDTPLLNTGVMANQVTYVVRKA